MEHSLQEEEKGSLIFVRSKGILGSINWSLRGYLGFGAIILYNCYTWPLTERIFNCELLLTNKVDKLIRKNMG